MPRGYGSRTQFCQNPRQKQEGNWHTSLSSLIQYLSSPYLSCSPFLLLTLFTLSLLPQLWVKFLYLILSPSGTISAYSFFFPSTKFAEKREQTVLGIMMQEWHLRSLIPLLYSHDMIGMILFTRKRQDPIFILASKREFFFVDCFLKVK